jgi:hypothetical protein
MIRNVLQNLKLHLLTIRRFSLEIGMMTKIKELWIVLSSQRINLVLKWELQRLYQVPMLMHQLLMTSNPFLRVIRKRLSRLSKILRRTVVPMLVSVISKTLNAEINKQVNLRSQVMKLLS